MIRQKGLLFFIVLIVMVFASCEQQTSEKQSKPVPGSEKPVSRVDESAAEQRKTENNLSKTEQQTEKLAELEPDGPESVTLDWALAGAWRGDDSARDASRHPREVLAFFGVRPDMNIVEIWPGGGWYSALLAPWVHKGGGVFTAAIFDPKTLNTPTQGLNTQYRARFADKDLYGDIIFTALGPDTKAVVPKSSADVILSFRNVHNWMAGGYAQKAFQDFYDALKPGGVLGIVEHRLPASRDHDPKARSGYVQEAYVKKLAEEAGFAFVSASEVNANPKDKADHPFGVWTLPPVARTSPVGEKPDPGFDRKPYDAIGESDRMTLKFRKPLRDTPPESKQSRDEDGGAKN